MQHIIIILSLIVCKNFIYFIKTTFCNVYFLRDEMLSYHSDIFTKTTILTTMSNLYVTSAEEVTGKSTPAILRKSRQF